MVKMEGAEGVEAKPGTLGRGRGLGPLADVGDSLCVGRGPSRRVCGKPAATILVRVNIQRFERSMTDQRLDLETYQVPPLRSLGELAGVRCPRNWPRLGCRALASPPFHRAT